MTGARVRVGMHRLDAEDEPAFQALLRAVYGGSYSYAYLYEPGGMARLLEGGRATLWGDFDSRGELVGHTGVFYKGADADFAESGMSFRRPKSLPTTSDAQAFQRILDEVSSRVTYLHQNTSTWHPLAQRFAERHMHAKPAGLILEYVEPHERIVGLPAPSSPMNAVTMTTCFGPEPESAPVRIPSGPFAAWLVERFAAFGIRADIVDPGPELPYSLCMFDQAPCLGLTRHRVVEGEGGSLSPLVESRTTLVHVPTDARVHVLPLLQMQGFLPIGIRPRRGAPHEIVAQKVSLAGRGRALQSLEKASLTPSSRVVAETWSSACARLT